MTTSLVTNDSPYFLTRVDIADINYALTGTTGLSAAVTSLTATRTITLPPATQKGQIVEVFDEHGHATEAIQIIVAPDGTDVIENLRYNSLTFPFASVKLQSSGAGTWNVVCTNIVHLGAGMITDPSYTNNGDGTITVGAGVYNLFANASGLGRIKAYNVAGGTFTPTDGSLSYLVCEYNGGTPIMYVVTDVTVINETTIIPVITFYREGLLIHTLKWDNLGKALPNKIHQSIVKTQRFRRASGLNLGEVATRTVTIGTGIIWYGAANVTLPAFNSSTDSLLLYYHSAPNVWTETPVTQYDNSHYDDNTGGLITLTGVSKYAVNFVYEIVSDTTKRVYIVLGQGNYLLGDAQLSQPPTSLPPEISSMAVLVGRIIVANGAATATQIDSAFAIQFSPSAINDHNSLTGLQGGTTAQYYHLTSAEYTGTGTDVFVRKNAPTFGTGTTAFSDTTLATSNTTGSVLLNGSIGQAVTSTSTSGTESALNSVFTITPSGVTTEQALGITQKVVSAGANPVASITGTQTTVMAGSSAGTTPVIIGQKIILGNSGAGTVTSSYGLWLTAPTNSGGGTLSNSYAIIIDSMTAAGTNYVFRSNGAGLFRVGDTTDATVLGTAANVMLGGLSVAKNFISGGYNSVLKGANVASATTITPTGMIFHVTGTTAIATINLPFAAFTGTITIIPDGIFTTTTAGNIALASTAVVSKALTMTYDGTKWYPSY